MIAGQTKEDIMRIRLDREEIAHPVAARDEAVRVDRERKDRITFLRRRIADIEAKAKERAEG